MARAARTIRSFSELHDVAFNHGNGHFIYRGENDTKYTLRPKFGRQKAINGKNDNNIEKEMLENFKRRGISHIEQLPENDWEWLAHAQHFGLATRLLDWTENLLVAAYFALTEPTRPGDRRLYVMDQDKLDLSVHKISPFEIQNVTIYRPKHLNARISSQMGLFTVHPYPEMEFNHASLERWIIKEKAVVDLNVTLDTFGFNIATMFPDLDGLAAHINDWHIR